MERPKRASWLRVRFVIALLASLCTISCYIARQNLSMAVVSMVVDTEQQVVKQATSNSSLAPAGELDLSARHEGASCPAAAAAREGSATSGDAPLRPISFGPKFAWSSSDRSLLFGAFFWTYVIFQVPAARLAERAGAKWVLALAGLGSALLSVASPWAAAWHVYALAAVRALMGLCQTALFPACYVLYANWLPPLERSLAIPILNVGAYVGSIFASTLTGYFSEQARFGWPWAFYAPGALSGAWLALWLWLAADSPRAHQRISLEELAYIEARLEPAAQAERRSISWRRLLGSSSVWAMVAAFFASNWSFSVLLLLLPSYLNDIQHIAPFKNGLINSVIYALYCVASPLVASASTMMLETRALGLTRLRTRKLFESVALLGQALCFLALPLIGCNQSLVLAVLFTQIVLFSFINGGEVHIPTELSVDFSGTIYAVGNCIGSSTGFLAPMLHSLVVTDSSERAQWDTFFYLAATICLLGAVLFLLFGQNQLIDFSSHQLSESQLHICPAESRAEPTTCKHLSILSLAKSSPPPPPRTLASGQRRHQQQVRLVAFSLAGSPRATRTEAAAERNLSGSLKL